MLTIVTMDEKNEIITERKEKTTLSYLVKKRT